MRPLGQLLTTEDWTGADDRRAFTIGEDAADVFSALSSETARAALLALYEQPRTASDLADSIDTSIQNANHHLDNLESSGLVTTTGTELSETNYEMKRYEPVYDQIAVTAGEDPVESDEQRSTDSHSGSDEQSLTPSFSLRELQIAAAAGVVLGAVLATLVRRIR